MFDVTDSIGRAWQLGTIQLDYAQPERFELTYVGEDNTAHQPVLIHRAGENPDWDGPRITSIPDVLDLV